MKKLTKTERAALAENFGGHCGYCGVALGARWCADHMEPVLRQSKLVRSSVDDGPAYKVVQTGRCFRPEHDSVENLMPSCAPCNMHKGALGVEAWRSVLQDSLKILARNYSTYRTAVRFRMLIEQPSPTITFFFEAALAASSDTQAQAGDGHTVRAEANG